MDTQQTNEYFFDKIQDGFLVDDVNRDNVHIFIDFKAIRMNYMNEGEHYQLDLIEHLWTQKDK